MPAYAGRLWAVSILIGASYVPLAGMRTRSFTINNTQIDVTTADSAGRWRELLPAAGVQQLDMEVAGVFQNDPAAKAFIQAASSSTFVTLRLVASGIQIDGTFQVGSFEEAAPFNQEVTFTCQFMSSGQPTIAIS